MLRVHTLAFKLGLLASFPLLLPACADDTDDSADDDNDDTDDNDDDTDDGDDTDTDDGEDTDTDDVGDTGTDDTGTDDTGTDDTGTDDTGTDDTGTDDTGTDDTGTDDTGTDDTGTDTDTDTDPGLAAVRVIHASPDAGNVDLYVEGSDQPIIADLAYGSATDYLEVPAGDYNFLVRPAGAPATDDPVHETGMVTLGADVRISAVAVGLLESTATEDAFRVLTLGEEFSDPATGEAMVRVVHAGSDAPTVGIDVGNDGSVELTGVDRFADSGAEGVAVPSGEALQIGIVDGSDTVTAFTTPELPDGGELFVIATGLLAPPPRAEDGFMLLAVSSAGALDPILQNPTVFALHAGPDVPEVDVCSGTDALLEGVTYGDMGQIQVPPGTYTLDFYDAGTDCTGTAVSSQDTPALAAGERYLAVATGEVSSETDDPSFDLAAFPEAFTLDADTEAVVRVAHMASAPNVDVGVVEAAEIAEADILIEDLAWPEQSDELTIAAEDVTVGLAAAGGTPPLTPVASFDLSPTAGLRAWIVAAGDLSGDTDEPPVSLFIVDTTMWPWAITEVAAN